MTALAEKSGTDLLRLKPWVSLVAEVSGLTGENPYRLAALGLRESGWGWAPGYEPKGDPCGSGDGGHGRGLFQIDDRWHQEFVGSADFRDPLKQALYACKILRENRDWFKRSSMNTQDADFLERCVYASYNAGPAVVRRQVIVGHGPDVATTGHDYSLWIWNKADELRRKAPDLFNVAPA